ncbi:MAG: HAD family phosphatase [Gemmataceae bacterium]
MPLAEPICTQVERFVRETQFAKTGAVITDLDGTAVLEDQGRCFVPPPVEFGLKRLYDIGRPVIIDTLRFPLSVIKTFGREWHRISAAPIPCVTLNGSLLGYVTEGEDKQLVFEELSATPLAQSELREILIGVTGLLEKRVPNLTIFYYPRDWKLGEIIWTPEPSRVSQVGNKYGSATEVFTGDVGVLESRLMAQDICMVFMLLDAPQDQLMAYQHTKRSNFFTHKGIDKASGAKTFAKQLNVELPHSVGAGDAETDRFLTEVGLAVHVGPIDLEYKGLRDTVRLRDSNELGDLLFHLADRIPS